MWLALFPLTAATDGSEVWGRNGKAAERPATLAAPVLSERRCRIALRRHFDHAVLFAAVGLAILPNCPPTRAVAANDAVAILVVYANDATQPAAIELARGLRNRLEHGTASKFEAYSEYLDLQRFCGPENLARRASEIRGKYGGLPIDVVIALGPGALKFMLEHRDIAPGAPLVFGAVRAESAEALSLPEDTMGVVSHFDVKGTVELARRLQPDARDIVVVTGSADFDRAWQAIAGDELASLPDDFEVTFLSNRTVEGFSESVQKLTPETIPMLLTVVQDAEGKRFIPRDVAGQLAQASGAPSYAVYSTAHRTKEPERRSRCKEGKRTTFLIDVSPARLEQRSAPKNIATTPAEAGVLSNDRRRRALG